MTDLDEHGRFTIDIELSARPFTPWDWRVTDSQTGDTRSGRSSRESWAREDSRKAIGKMRRGA